MNKPLSMNKPLFIGEDAFKKPAEKGGAKANTRMLSNAGIKTAKADLRDPRYQETAGNLIKKTVRNPRAPRVAKPKPSKFDPNLPENVIDSSLYKPPPAQQAIPIVLPRSRVVPNENVIDSSNLSGGAIGYTSIKPLFNNMGPSFKGGASSTNLDAMFRQLANAKKVSSLLIPDAPMASMNVFENTAKKVQKKAKNADDVFGDPLKEILPSTVDNYGLGPTKLPDYTHLQDFHDIVNSGTPNAYDPDYYYDQSTDEIKPVLTQEQFMQALKKYQLPPSVKRIYKALQANDLALFERITATDTQDEDVLRRIALYNSGIGDGLTRTAIDTGLKAYIIDSDLNVPNLEVQIHNFGQYMRLWSLVRAINADVMYETCVSLSPVVYFICSDNTSLARGRQLLVHDTSQYPEYMMSRYMRSKTDVSVSNMPLETVSNVKCAVLDLSLFSKSKSHIYIRIAQACQKIVNHGGSTIFVISPYNLGNDVQSFMQSMPKEAFIHLYKSDHMYDNVMSGTFSDLYRTSSGYMPPPSTPPFKGSEYGLGPKTESEFGFTPIKPSYRSVKDLVDELISKVEKDPANEGLAVTDPELFYTSLTPLYAKAFNEYIMNSTTPYEDYNKVVDASRFTSDGNRIEKLAVPVSLVQQFAEEGWSNALETPTPPHEFTPPPSEPPPSSEFSSAPDSSGIKPDDASLLPPTPTPEGEQGKPQEQEGSPPIEDLPKGDINPNEEYETVQSRLPPVDPVELEMLKTLNLANKANAQRVYNFLKGRRMDQQYNTATDEVKDTYPPPFIYGIVETANYVTDKGLIYNLADKDKPLSERQTIMSELMKNHGDDANIRELFDNIFTLSLNADIAGSHAPQELFTELNPKFVDELFKSYLDDRETFDNAIVEVKRPINKLDPNRNRSTGDIVEEQIYNPINATNPTLGGPVIPQPSPEDKDDSARRNAEESAEREYQKDKDAVKEQERLKEEPEGEPEDPPEESQETIESKEQEPTTPKKKEPTTPPSDIPIAKFSKTLTKPEELKAGDYVAFSLYRSSNKKLSNVIGKEEEDVSLMRVIEMKGDTVYVASPPLDFKSKAMKDKKIIPNTQEPDYRYYDNAIKNNLLKSGEFIYRIDRRSDFYKYWPTSKGTEKVKLEYVAVHTRPIPTDALVHSGHASPRTPPQKKTEDISPPVPNPESELPRRSITTGDGFDFNSGYAGGNIRYHGSGDDFRGGASGFDDIRSVFYPLNVNNLGPFIVLNNVTTNLWRIDV